MREDMREAVIGLNDKLQVLAQQWGECYGMKAAVVLDRGTLWLRKKGQGWHFLWEPPGEQRERITSAPAEARLDAVHALPDLLQEILKAQSRRMIDLDEAHEVLDQLILQGAD